MPDKKDPLPVVGKVPKFTPSVFGQDGESVFQPTEFTGEPILPGGEKSTKYRNGYSPYTDPFFSGGIDRDFDSRMKAIEGGLDNVQPWYDKLGNGVVKFAGSFADGILSTAGTIYGIPASLITWDKTQMWDNPFTNLGQDISDAVNENFRNYRSVGEQNANAWSPSYWMTMNFLSDNILGNLGYATSAIVTGAGVSKVLGKLAPFIAGRNLTTGLDIINDGGMEALKDMSKAYSAVKQWDAAQQAMSVGISSAGEASVEALSAYRESKQKMIGLEAQKYGGEDNIPDSVLQKIDQDSKSVGNITYGLNLPILAGANMIQWGKSLSGFSSEFKQMSKNAPKLRALEEFGTYGAAEDAVKSGVSKGLARTLSTTGKALKSNIAEAGQEGAQYIVSEGTKNWYSRDHDQRGWDALAEYTDPYTDALVKLVTTQEGVANLLGGFAGGAPFGLKDYVRAIAGDPKAKELMDKQLDALNSPFTEFGGGTIRDNLKIYMQNLARHASAEHDLQDAIARGDEKNARSAKFDQLKSYINSRIQTGRMDLLEDEINQLKSMNEEDFKSFFSLDPADAINKNAVLDKFKNTATEMHDTYKMMDRLFNPDMYRLNKLAPEERDSKLADLHQYKQMLWSYMMDYKDRDQRAKQLDTEIGAAFSNMLNMDELFKDNFKTDELNDLYHQYVASNVEHELNKAANPAYKNSAKEAEVTALKSKLKSRINELTNNNPAAHTTIDEFQGTGKKDFIEDYLFNVNKRIIPAINNPVVQTAIGKEDINHIITKTHDLVDLHAERRQAIYVYNQLASVVKTGDFMGRYVNNPAYKEEKHKDIEPTIQQKNEEGQLEEVPNPEYVPKRIPSNDLLNYNGYADRHNERDNFYREQQANRDKNENEIDAFNADLDARIDENVTETSKDFHNKVTEITNGSENIKAKPLKALTIDQLSVLQGLSNRNLQAKIMRSEFDVATKKDRDNFDHSAYTSAYAHLKAVNDEIKRRAKIRTDEIEKRANEVVNYVNANNISTDLLVPGFKIGNNVVNTEIVKRAAAIIAETKARNAREEQARRQAELASAPKPTVKVTATRDEEPIVDDEIYAQLKKDGKLDAEFRGAVFPDIAKKLANGDLLTPREDEVYQLYKEQLDKKVKAKYGTDPIYNVKTVSSGKYVEQEPVISSDETTDDTVQQSVVETARAAERISPEKIEGPFIRLQRSDLQTTDDRKENKYDSEGNVIPNQLTPMLFDAASPVNLLNKPEMRFRHVGFSKHGDKEEPTLLLEVRADDKSTWLTTNYFMQGLYDLKGELINPTFSKDPAENKQKVEAYKDLLKDMQAEAVKSGTVSVSTRGGISFGSLIENKKDKDGNRERRGLVQSFGDNINDPAATDSVKLGVIFSHTKTDAIAVYRDERSPAGELTDMNEIPGVYLPKALINAVANAGGKGTGDRGGQYVALLPTGQMTPDGSSQVHYPVLLAGKLLSAYTSGNYSIGSGRNKGTSANIGEVLIDALLNPYKEEYNELFPALFEMAGLNRSDYKGPDETNWKAFYTDANIYEIVNRVMFSATKTLDNPDTYKRPFKFEIIDTSERGGAIMARIGIADSMLKDRKTVDIFLSTKEGKLVKPQNDAEKQDFVQHRIDQTYEFRKKSGKTDSNLISYADIQDVIKDKAFHVQIARMSQRSPVPFTGFKFNDTGKLITQTYPSYIHYVDDLGLAQATVQGITDNQTGRRQYFVNQRVYLNRQSEPKQQTDPITDLFGPKPDIKKPKKQGDVILGKGLGVASEILTGTKVKATIHGMPSKKADENAKSEANRNPISAIAAANKIGNSRTRKKGMMSLDVYKSINQRDMTVGGSIAIHARELIVDEISSILLDKMIDMRTKNRGSYSVVKLKGILKDAIGQRIYNLMQSARPSLEKKTYSQWKKLPADHPDFDWLDETEESKLSELEYNQYQSLLNAYEFFDIDDFNAMFKAGEMDEDYFNQIFLGGTREEPLFFIGYGNRALAKLAELNIIKAVNNGNTEIELDEETGNYTQRFNDSWALQVNPKDTLGMQAKIVLNTIPQVTIKNDPSGVTEVVKQTSATGFNKYMKYDTAFITLVNMGLDAQPEQFEYELMENPAYDLSPVVKAVRIKMAEIRSQKGVDLYNQVIRQLATTVTGLRMNTVTQLILNKNEGKPVFIKIFQGARQNVNGQIADIWQSQFSNAVSNNDYIAFTESYNESAGIFVTKPSLSYFNYEAKGKKGPETKQGDFADIFITGVKEIMQEHVLGKSTGKLTFEGYLSLAHLVHDMLGIQLVEGDFANKDKAGYGTAAVFQFIADSINSKNQEDRMFRNQLKKENIKSFDEFINRTFVDNLVKKVRQAVKDGTYNDDEPFRNSATAMSLLSRMFQHYHQSIVNPQAKDANGKNQYVYVPADMLRHEFRRFQSPEYVTQLHGLPILEFDYHLNQQFLTDPNGEKPDEFAPRSYWKNMRIEDINAMKLTSDIRKKRKGRNKGDVIEARKIPAGDVDILSMVLFQNEEVTRSGDTIDRGQAKYFLPFGDSSAASVLNFNKYAFQFDYHEGKLTIREGQVRDILYSHFKSEVNRIKNGFDVFDHINNSTLTLEQKKKQLRKGYHYFDRGDAIIPGAAIRMYYFGRKNYNVSEGSALYETMEVNGEIRPVGLKEELFDQDGNFADIRMRPVFDTILNDFLSDVVNSKMQQMAPLKESFFELDSPEEEGDKFASPRYKNNIIDTRYADSLKHIFTKSSTIDGKVIKDYGDREVTLFNSPQEANDNGYHAQLLKTAIIDQQVNALIANNLVRRLTWDLASFDENGDWDQFQQVLGKRESGFNSPYMVTATKSNVDVIIFNDVVYGNKKVNYADIVDGLKPEETALFDFMKKNGLAEYITDKVPARYRELTAIHYAAVMDKLPAKEIASILKAALKSKLTDGGTVITLREYLFQMQQQGVITYSDFGRLYNKYNNADLKLTEEDKKDLLFKGQKMVGIGSVILADQKAPLYMKDAKIVLIPSQVKGTRYEGIMNSLYEREDKSLVPSPGIQLAPVSAMKKHSGQVIDLFDQDDNIIPAAITNASVFSFPRGMYGEQVQNPTKEAAGITKGIQLQKYMFDNVYDDKIFAEDMFTGPQAAQGPATIHKKAGKVYGKTDGRKIPEKGATKVELRNNMIDILRHMHELKLQDLVDKFGLDYSISDEWKAAAREQGFDDMDAFQESIDRMEQSKSYEERQAARDLNYRKYGLVARTIGKMINDVKQQAYTKKGIEISQLRALNEIQTEGDGGDKVERLRMALTFTPGNKQFQQVILAEIQNLFAHTKLNGFGGIQISAAGHEHMDAPQGSTTLKGYGLKYDNDNNVIGFDHAEIGIPWIFKDSSGKPLAYEKYVNEDGTPKTEMFDPEVLQIVGYRIPNTGLNMAGVFNVARFFKPGYSDSVMIPDILFSQMGTDLDFDKLYNYVYNYRTDKNGRIRKVQGVINPRQNNAKAILNTEESRRWALHNSLVLDDPGYRMKYKLFKQAYQKLMDRLDELAPVTTEEPEQTNNIFTGMDPREIAELKARLDNESVTDTGNTEEREQMIKQFQTIVNDFNSLQATIDKRKANFNHEGWLNMRADNYLKAQSYKQLENAYFDIYHIVMGDMEMLPAMLHPLTPDMINNQVEEPRYDGRSISQMEASSIVEAPNTEVYQSKVRGDNKSSKENIGALANGQSTIDAMQTANISVGSKDEEVIIRPVVFMGNDNKIIEEDDTDPVRFVTPTVNTAENTGGYSFTKMQYSLNKTTYNVPNRLARIYGVDGKTKVTSIVQSLLQSFLDFNNNRNVAYTNVNLATLNPLMAMITLGYTDHIFDFAAQEILVDYTKGFYAERSPFQKTTDFLYRLVDDYTKRAGLGENTFATYVEANDGDVESALHQMLIEQKLGDQQYNYERFFSPDQLHNMIVQRFGDKKGDYNINQLFVLDMFMRLKTIGEPMFYLMQSINLESKGFNNVSILGALDQINNHNYVGMRYNPISGKLSSSFLIGSERLGPWSAEDNPNGMQSVYSLALAYAKKGMGILRKNNGVFADLTPIFKHSRSTLASMTGKRNLGNQERFNINIIQYLLSNVELYHDFLDVIPEGDRSNAHDIRKHIFMDDLEITPETKNHITTVKTKVLASSLARMIEDIKTKEDPTSKISYSELYPVLNYFRTTVKNNLASPSWVKTENTAQFKERIGQETPANIQRMLADPNPEINKIAKYMFMYYYLGSGVTTPNSIGHLLPQEMLFLPGGFADKLNEMRDNLDRGIEALEREVNSSRTMKDYDKPWWFRQFDPNIVKVNRDASLKQLDLYTQYLQNNPFEAEMSDYEKGIHFEPTNDPAIVRITQKGKVVSGEEKYNPKSFIEIIPGQVEGDKPIYNLYVINPDYNTYTRVNRAGTTNYVEFNYGNRFSPTLIQANELKDNTPVKEDKIDDVTLGPNKILVDSKDLVPVQMDKENDLNAVFQLAFLNEDSRRGEEFIDNPVEQKELIALAEAIFPAIPAHTKLIPYSIKKAKKDFQSSDGLITVKGKSAFGSFRPGNPNGLIQVAYQFIDQDKTDPLLMKKVLLHESTHAATYNVFKVLEKLQNKQLTKSEAYKILGLDKNSEAGPVGDIQTMLSAFKKYNELFEYLKTNTALRKAYVKANGNENNKKGETNDLGRLNVIMADIDEFTARLFNDKQFRDALKTVPYNKKTIFDRILDFLKDILGLQPGTAAYHAFGNLMEILEPVKGAKIATEGWRTEDVDKIFSANTATEQKALLELKELYRDVSNFDSQYASPEELKLYDRLVKEGKIIC